MSLRYFLFFFLISGLNTAEGKVIPCKPIEKLPNLSSGCEGEACGILTYDKAIQDAIVVDHPATKIEIDQLKKCELIEDFNPQILIRKVGGATITRPSKALKKIGVSKGDIIKITNYDGEGVFKGCAYNKFFDIAEETDLSTNLAKNITSAQTEAWVKVKTPRGKIGYISGHDFYMGRYSFDISKLCGSDHPLGKDHIAVEKKVLKTLEKQIQDKCADNSALEEGKSICKSNDAIWNELTKVTPKLLDCSEFELSKAFAGFSWIGYLKCKKPQNSLEKFQLNFNCQKLEEPPNDNSKSTIECFIGS